MERRTESGGPRRLRGGPLILLAVALLSTAWAFRELPRLGFTDIDGPTLLRVSRVESPADLLHLLSMEYRDDPREGAGFYRPLTSLSFAVALALHGPSPGPFHGVDLAIHLGVGLVLFALGRSLRLSPWAAAMGTALLLLHPIAAEVVPSLARRSESLAMLCLGLALWMEASGRRRWAMFFALLAPLAKESGFVVIFLLPLATPGGIDKRRTAGLFLALGALLLLRSALLGALIGGYEEKFVSPAVLPRAFVDLVDSGRLLGLWGARAAAVLFLLLALRNAKAVAARVGGMWLIAALALVQLSGGLGAWYLYAALPGLALLMGAMLNRPGRLRWLAFALGLLSIAGSPAWIHYPEWAESARWNRRLREAVLAAVDAEFSGPLILAGIPVHQGQGPGRRFHLRSVNVGLGWSLRDAIHLETGREIELFGAAHVRLEAAPAEYALRARRRDDGLELALEGQAQFSSGDLASELFGLRVLPFASESEGGRVVLSELQAPLLYWDGEGFARAP